MAQGTLTADPGFTSPPVVVEEEEEPRGAFSLRGAAAILLSSMSGRIGLAMFAVMLTISAYVLIAYPRDFGSARWSSPVVWANNPKTAPPVWTALYNDNAVRHLTFALTEPTEVTARGAGEIRSYVMEIDHESGAAPQFLSVTIPGVTFSVRAPFLRVDLLRPDGGEITLANIAVPAARPGEEAPIRRFYDVPERVLLTQQETAATSIGQWYAEAYPDQPAPTGLANRLNAALFGVPGADGAIENLQGDYQLRVQAVVADTSDEIAGVDAVYGGTVYGMMGTDSLGRDLFEGLLYGFPIALLIAAMAATLSTLIGASLGIISGYSGGKTDSVIQRMADIVSNVPVLPLLIFLVFILGSNLYLILLVLVAFSWPGLTILVRSMVLQLRSGQLVEAAKALGASRRRILTRHVFPQVAPFIVAQMIFFAPAAILAEASLSFLGLGDPSIPTWGQMLEAGFRTGALYVGYWWWVIPPGVLIIVTALAFMLLALGMEQVVDPRLRNAS
jgi:peptide/nickel transport system permease protein